MKPWSERAYFLPGLQDWRQVFSRDRTAEQWENFAVPLVLLAIPPQPRLLLHISFSETEALPVSVLKTEAGEQITPLDATSILLSAGNWVQRVSDNPDIWRFGFLWNYLLFIERETFCHDHALPGLHNYFQSIIVSERELLLPKLIRVFFTMSFIL